MLSRGVSSISRWYKYKTSATAAHRPARHRSCLTGFQCNRRQTTHRKLGANVGASRSSEGSGDGRHNNFAPGLTSARGSPRRRPLLFPGRVPVPAGRGGEEAMAERNVCLTRSQGPGELSKASAKPKQRGRLERLRRGADRALEVMCIGAGSGK